MLKIDFLCRYITSRQMSADRGYKLLVDNAEKRKTAFFNELHNKSNLIDLLMKYACIETTRGPRMKLENTKLGDVCYIYLAQKKPMMRYGSGLLSNEMSYIRISKDRLRIYGVAGNSRIKIHIHACEGDYFNYEVHVKIWSAKFDEMYGVLKYYEIKFPDRKLKKI